MQDSQISSNSYQTNYLNSQYTKPLSTVNWVSVIKFLQEESIKSTIREKQWYLQKKILNQQISKLKVQLDTIENLNINLNNRIKLLEMTLKKQKLKKNQNKEVQTQNKQQLNKNILEIQKYFEKNGWNLKRKIDIKQQNSHTQFLKKILSQVGMNLTKIEQKYPKILQKSNNQIQIQIKKSQVEDFRSLIRDLQRIKIQNKYRINAHLDSIRGIYVKQSNYLSLSLITTVSQDCLLKNWSINQKSRNDNMDPISTYRQHTGQLFALEGGQNILKNDDLVLFSGGSQQFVKVWYASNSQKFSSLCNVGYFQNDSQNSQENQIIWQIKYKSNRLLTSTSDGAIRLFNVGIQKNTNSNNQFSSLVKMIHKFSQKAYSHNVIEWVGQKGFLSGSNNFPKITLWDIETGRIMQKYQYQIEKQKDQKKKDSNFNYDFQINSIKYMQDNKLILTACEDKSLRIFSYNQNKIIKRIDSNIRQSLNCIDTYKINYIVAGCQDGSMKIWDRRTYKLLFDDVIHLTKYNQGIMCLKTTQKAIYSGGADGIVKIFGF